MVGEAEDVFTVLVVAGDLDDSAFEIGVVWVADGDGVVDGCGGIIFCVGEGVASSDGWEVVFSANFDSGGNSCAIAVAVIDCPCDGSVAGVWIFAVVEVGDAS